ncbi:unnamed protein product [Didymodactylos carnosus]|uniref:Uncharacterized protein n=1 Tax=Didymodactylos carnosus TaxID=1234261 RepID=A0A813Z2L9_9BILA|nr:unnamed protein product [Didymodactylos carnosus]CAF0892627.1 unnamed protein product [Didymodactylos carnosus]CAF3537396.1 unnamed protein product [Didymodactylos carnosus]CAF3676606.1 unnamed protein product [Didymodactylos carnosus]
MTSWQNIIDNLPKKTRQNQTDYSPDHHQQQQLSDQNYNEDKFQKFISRRRSFIKKRPIGVPKFNLLALKPQENFQPYNMTFWGAQGVIEDDTIWKKSLRDLAMSLGFITQHEIDRITKPATLANFYGPPSTTGSLRTAPQTTSTPRFNERLPPPSRGERTFHIKPLWYYRVDDHERESWMLQILCQLLGTSDLALVQTWLASAHKSEKELARQLLVRALEGLGEGDRFRAVAPSLDLDIDTLNNYVAGIDVPQLPVQGIFRPVVKHRQLRPLSEKPENKVQESKTEDELLAEFSSPTLAVMQTTPKDEFSTSRLRTPFLPPIPKRWINNKNPLYASTIDETTTPPSRGKDTNIWKYELPVNSSAVFS